MGFRFTWAASARDERGFTLIELLTVITVMAVLMAVAVPAFDGVRLSTRLNAYANSLVAASQLARSEAIKRNATVTLCPSANGTSCAADGKWEAGWIVLSDTTVLRAQPAATAGYYIHGSTLPLSFDATGLGVNQATLTICRATPTVGSQERVVKISATGRTSIANTTTGSCS